MTLVKINDIIYNLDSFNKFKSVGVLRTDIYGDMSLVYYSVIGVVGDTDVTLKTFMTREHSDEFLSKLLKPYDIKEIT